MSAAASAAGAARLDGHLEIVAAPDEKGRTFLRHQSFRAPVHLGKGHTDEGALVLNVVNPTAGLLDGDRLRVDVRVENGARLLLTTPGASRVHTMRGGRAVVTQDFRIEAGGSLEWWPEMLIPQRGARYEQRTRIHLAADAELLFQETLAPGRVASGECFLYDELRWAADIWRDGKLLARERFLITPDNAALAAFRRRFPTGYYTSIFFASPLLALANGIPATLLALESDHPELWCGVTRVESGLCAIKMLSADSLVLRRALAFCRAEIYRSIGRKPPDLRRNDLTAKNAENTKKKKERWEEDEFDGRDPGFV